MTSLQTSLKKVPNLESHRGQTGVLFYSVIPLEDGRKGLRTKVTSEISKI